MKLLIITQKVDINDDVLGFFNQWIEEFAKHCEKITVVCLQKGPYNLPDNVKVLSLGKEKGTSRLKYLCNFYKYIWSERKNYEKVFVHMNQEYVLLGGIFWKMFGKKIYMWRNHHIGSILTDIAAIFCKKVFCTSKFSFTAKYKNTVIMPIGVDIEVIKHIEPIKRISQSVLFLARISPSKRPGLFIDAVLKVKEKISNLKGSVYGNPLPRDEYYYQGLKDIVANNKAEAYIHFYKGPSYPENMRVFFSHSVFVNTSSSGMYDKTIFEAMACGCLILASNDNLRGKISDNFIFKQGDILELSEKLEKLLNYNDEERQNASRELKNFAKNNSLKILSEKLFFNM